MSKTDSRAVTPQQVDWRITQARTLARLLDTAARVPGTNIRFGLDSVLGLIPGLGDAAGAIFSGYLVLLAGRLGVSRPVIARMVGNVALDSLVGGVPILGDLFDVAWKSNTRNLALLEEHTGHIPTDRRPASRFVIIAALAALALLLAGGIWLAVIALKALIGAFS